MKTTALLVLLAALPSLCSPALGHAQIFTSTQGPNLPTAETIGSGQLMFEISHRFLPPVSTDDSFGGLDGPALYRLGLAYAPTDRVLLGVLRSNLEDNLELNAKVRVFENGEGPLSVAVALMGGNAWNTDVVEVAGAEDGETQQYVQAILDVGLGERLAVGIVPSLLRNPRIRDAEAETTLAVGVNGKLQLTGGMSAIGEWLFAEERPDLGRDAGTFGIQISTRGHAFKLLVSNQPRLNPTQYLGGSPFEFDPDEWRLGFNITRRIVF